MTTSSESAAGTDEDLVGPDAATDAAAPAETHAQPERNGPSGGKPQPIKEAANGSTFDHGSFWVICIGGMLPPLVFAVFTLESTSLSLVQMTGPLQLAAICSGALTVVIASIARRTDRTDDWLWWWALGLAAILCLLVHDLSSSQSWPDSATISCVLDAHDVSASPDLCDPRWMRAEFTAGQALVQLIQDVESDREHPGHVVALTVLTLTLATLAHSYGAHKGEA